MGKGGKEEGGCAMRKINRTCCGNLKAYWRWNSSSHYFGFSLLLSLREMMSDPLESLNKRVLLS